ncbi:hypothetical protein EVAR_83285_1 [Eumeta japonica]|uniref:Uncharacterized protein n=1 Tax=Eumeta variegata TaxID=151549 RepID=A0A4C1X6Z5_EUMVA|nr:hypothetical protein EVAR_83285_1 [Eumeta japonica]
MSSPPTNTCDMEESLFKNRSYSDPWNAVKDASAQFPPRYLESLHSFYSSFSPDLTDGTKSSERRRSLEDLKLKMERFFDEQCRIFSPEDNSFTTFDEALQPTDTQDYFLARPSVCQDHFLRNALSLVSNLTFDTEERSARATRRGRSRTGRLQYRYKNNFLRRREMALDNAGRRRGAAGRFSLRPENVHDFRFRRVFDGIVFVDGSRDVLFGRQKAASLVSSTSGRSENQLTKVGVNFSKSHNRSPIGHEKGKAAVAKDASDYVKGTGQVRRGKNAFRRAAAQRVFVTPPAQLCCVIRQKTVVSYIVRRQTYNARRRPSTAPDASPPASLSSRSRNLQTYQSLASTPTTYAIHTANDNNDKYYNAYSTRGESVSRAIYSSA